LIDQSIMGVEMDLSRSIGRSACQPRPDDTLLRNPTSISSREISTTKEEQVVVVVVAVVSRTELTNQRGMNRVHSDDHAQSL